MEEKIQVKSLPNSSIEKYKFKVVVVGDSGVGKTNLIQRFINDKFNLDTKATVGVEFVSKNFEINGEVFKIEIWDTAGQERYKSITAAYYKGAKGAIIVYDVTNKDSFHNVDNWRNEIKERSSKNINLMIIGNKTDLKDKILITSEMATEKAKTFEIPVMETSALNASNVKNAFENLIQEMYSSTQKMLKEEENKKKSEIDNGVQLDTEEKKLKKAGCCS